jgi:hypothetical protein
MSTTRPSRSKASGPLKGLLGQGHSAGARKLAAVVLEVLAGLRSPRDAAVAAELSLPRYYAVELRALHGLLAACEPPPRGRQPATTTEVTALKRRLAELEKQCVRQQTLLRLAQRSIGLSPAVPPPSKPSKGQRRRRPRLRALKAIEELRQPAVAESANAQGQPRPS